MSSTIDRRFDRTATKSSNASQVSESSEQLLKKLIALAPAAGVLLAVTGLASLVTFSYMNGKLFFTELLISSFIVLALIFFKASAAPRR